jgi:hypothetical protein
MSVDWSGDTGAQIVWVGLVRRNRTTGCSQFVIASMQMFWWASAPHSTS